MSWPIDAWHRRAVCQLGITPSEFWAMPVAEWLQLIDPSDHRLDRAALEQLMEIYPDG